MRASGSGLTSVTLNAPSVAVINNIDARVETDPAAIREALYRQAYGAVRWVEVVQALRARGLTHIFECGPGKVLSGLVKRIDAEVQSVTVLDPATMAEARTLLG